MRDSGLTSISPNLAKSTFGQGSRSRPPPRLAPAAAAGVLPGTTPELIAPFTKAVTSSFRMRFFGPLALTCARSTPSSRA